MYHYIAIVQDKPAFLCLPFYSSLFLVIFLCSFQHGLGERVEHAVAGATVPQGNLAPSLAVRAEGAHGGVEVAGNRAQGILHGDSEDGCVVEVSKDYTVVVGDLVQTSGVDELFPQVAR